MSVSVQDAWLLEKVVDPSTREYKELLTKLLQTPRKDSANSNKLNRPENFKFPLPYRGDAESETSVSGLVPVTFAERSSFRNGVASLALTAAELLDLIAVNSGRKKMTACLVVSTQAQELYDSLVSAGHASTLIYYAQCVNLVDRAVSLADKLDTLVFDHVSVNVPVDQLLNFAYKAGIRVVDGVFPYHLAAVRGWDTVAGVGKWSYSHSGSSITVGPDDDPVRMMRYIRSDYMKFLRPGTWEGNSRHYLYEIRKCANGLAVYRAVYVGDAKFSDKSEETFKLPMCTSDDMILVNINRTLASGAFASRSNNARELSELDKDYAVEVRRDLFVSAVNYLISMSKNTDIVGDAIRYIYQHNYVDLVDGVRIVRAPSLGYADALCVAMVCALVAYTLRYRLTGESMLVITRAREVPRIALNASFGALGRLAWLVSTYFSDAVNQSFRRTQQRALQIFGESDYIPGVCYDVYMDNKYTTEGEWFEPTQLLLEPKSYGVPTGLSDRDPFVAFHGDNVAAYAPTVVAEKSYSATDSMFTQPRYVPNVVADPVVALQDVYDVSFPGNSISQIQNVAELRRVNNVNVNTEFHGKVEINKDIAAPERLHTDMPLRTAAIPVSRTPLLDAIMASAKRNFNPPDLQIQSAVFSYAKELAEEFVSRFFFAGFNDTLRATYEKNPVTFNMTDYMEWLAGKDGGYKSAMEAECPNEMVELELNRFDTIVKKRIKPKLSTDAQHELSQPQVIVSMSKKDTAPFTSVFRQIFKRFDSALAVNFKSAGRLSDDDISRWLTDHYQEVVTLEAVEADSGKYDKSQNLLARLVEAAVLEILGLDPGVNEAYADSYVGKVSSRSLGLGFFIYYQMKSGAPDTMLGNLIYNMVSAGRSIGYENVRMMIAKGDDNVMWLFKTFSGKLAVSKMANLFNLEVKLVTKSVLYFSSGYIVPVDDGYVYFVPDPLKLIELLGESGTDERTASEQFQSFRDRARSFAVHHAIPRLLQVAVRHRYSNMDIPVVTAIDAIMAIADSESLFRRIKFSV